MSVNGVALLLEAWRRVRAGGRALFCQTCLAAHIAREPARARFFAYQ